MGYAMYLFMPADYYNGPILKLYASIFYVANKPVHFMIYTTRMWVFIVYLLINRDDERMCPFWERNFYKRSFAERDIYIYDEYIHIYIYTYIYIYIWHTYICIYMTYI